MQRHDELVAAVRAGSGDAVAAALNAGASADERDNRGHTALMLACEIGDSQLVKALLDAGASPNRRTSEREETVLHQLARRPEATDLVHVVLQHRCRIDRRDRFGWTPLMVAAHSGAIEIAGALVAAGADTSVQSPDGRTVRELAEAAGHDGILAALST